MPAGTSSSGARGSRPRAPSARSSRQGDGGGKAPALARALHGRARVARTLTAGLRTTRKRIRGFTLRREDVNGQPGALFLDGDGDVLAVIILDIAEGQIQGVRAIASHVPVSLLACKAIALTKSSFARKVVEHPHSPGRRDGWSPRRSDGS